MKTIHPHITSPRVAILAGLSLLTPAFAVVNIDYVNIGNTGNVADPATGSLYGAVAYAFQIAKNETTIGQYAEFLNAVAKTDTYGLYSTSMATSSINGIARGGVSGDFTYSVASGSANKPITFIRWFDAARFANWMHNGQPIGAQTAATTEDGAYTLLGATSGVSLSKNVGATVWIPSESEWYKAANYDPTKNAGAGGYWLHANQSDSLTSNTVGAAGAVNFFDGDYVGSGTSSFPTTNALTDVGAYGPGSDSYYGANDLAGNVFEWTDAVMDGSNRNLRGGSWADLENTLRSSSRYGYSPNFADSSVGFRLASAVPEPTSLILTMLSASAVLLCRKRG